jgi:hypothetical protein
VINLTGESTVNFFVLLTLNFSYIVSAVNFFALTLFMLNFPLRLGAAARLSMM